MLQDPVAPSRHAAVDSSLRLFVNYELFLFANRSTKDRFRRDPTRYCGLLTDPVSRVRFRPAPRSPQTHYQGRLYFFSSDSTRTTFAGSPDSYALRKGG